VALGGGGGGERCSLDYGHVYMYHVAVALTYTQLHSVILLINKTLIKTGSELML
jgi:hypothetical protein